MKHDIATCYSGGDSKSDGDPLELPLLLFICFGFFASLVSAVFGFGTALLMLAVGSYILPVKEAIALATVLFCTSTISKTLLFRQHIDWRLAATMAITGLPFSYIGASLVAHLPTELLKCSLGLMILLYIVVSKFKAPASVKPITMFSTLGLLAGSALYGMLSGLLGSGNIIKVVFFREMKLSRECFVGTMAATAVPGNVAKLTAYTKAGLLNRDHLPTVIGLIASALLAAMAGRELLHSISAKYFESGVRLLLIVSAFGLLL